MNPQTQTGQTTGQNNQQTTTNQTCPNCGMGQEDWRGNNGQGFQMGDKTYCCQGCATGTGCTCQ